MKELNLFLTVIIPIVISLPLLAYSFIRWWDKQDELRRTYKAMEPKERGAIT